MVDCGADEYVIFYVDFTAFDITIENIYKRLAYYSIHNTAT